MCLRPQHIQAAVSEFGHCKHTTRGTHQSKTLLLQLTSGLYLSVSIHKAILCVDILIQRISETYLADMSLSAGLTVVTAYHYWQTNTAQMQIP